MIFETLQEGESFAHFQILLEDTTGYFCIVVNNFRHQCSKHSALNEEQSFEIIQ